MKTNPRKMDLEKEKGSEHKSAVLGVRRGTQLSYDRDFWIMGIYEQFYAVKFENLDKTDKF